MKNNKKKPKHLILLLIVITFLFAFTSCSKQNEGVEIETEDNSIEQTDPSSISVTEQIESVNEQTGKQAYFDFEVADLDLEKHNLSEYLAQNEINVVNIWATFCPPCKVELPDLQRISEDFADKNVAVVGIVTDVQENDQASIELAKSIFSEAGVEFPSFIQNDLLNNTILQEVYAVPTTYIINSEGKIISNPIVGAQNYDYFANIINNVLDK
ncbi:MAG: TlpA family protein disulfide reductase [Clostridiaceae bacterium]|nr:TlpA family protein disulfide reductase [Clostridiaceae bacterium]